MPVRHGIPVFIQGKRFFIVQSCLFVRFILRHYKFKADKQGKQNIKFTYKRNWEGGDTAYSLIYELTVDKDNTIHVDNVLTEGASQNNMLKNDYTFEN